MGKLSIARNVGRSIAFSSMEVLSQYAPNTTSFIAGAKTGLDDVRNFTRTNVSKLRTTTQLTERGALAKQARKMLSNAKAEIMQGNLSLGSMQDKMEAEFEDFQLDAEYDTPLSSGLESSELGEEELQTDEATGPNYDELQMKMQATVADHNIEAIKQMQTVLGNTQIQSADYITTRLGQSILTQTAIQSKHFGIVESQLEQINSNLAMLIEAQNTQSEVNQASLGFYDQVLEALKSETERREEARSPRAKRSGNKISDFLRGSGFDMDAYKGIVKDNFDSSYLGMGANMLTGGGLDLLLSQDFQPQKYLVNGLLNLALPKLGKRALRRGDSQISAALKTGLSRLGEYRYDMSSHAILGTLGSIFGIDPKMGRSLNLGGFKRGERTWNGEAQKALVQVIPKELAEIKAALLEKNAEYYDTKTGRYMSEDDALERARIDFKSAMENPFVNLFDKVSLDPDEAKDKEAWAGLGEDIQKQIQAAVNKAIGANAGLTQDSAREIRDLLASGGADERTVRRMHGKLAGAINTSRGNIADFMANMQDSDGAFMQILSSAEITDANGNRRKLANNAGKISYSDLQNYLGGVLDLIEANNGTYSQSGRRLDQMTEEEQRQESSMDEFRRSMLNRFGGSLDNNIQRGGIRGKVSRFIKNRIVGSDTAYGRAAERAIDRGYGSLYDAFMYGDLPESVVRARDTLGTVGENIRSRFRRNDEEGGEGEGGTPPAPTPPPPNPENGPTPPTPPSPNRFDYNGNGPTFSRYSYEEPRPVSDMTGPGQPPGKGKTLADIQREEEEKSSGSEKNRNNAENFGGVMNTLFKENENGGETPEDRTAKGVESLVDINEGAFGENGFMRKVFDSPAIKALFNWFKNSALGKKIGEWKDRGKAELGKIFSKDYKDDEGQTYKSPKTYIQEALNPLVKKAATALGMKPKPSEGEENTDQVTTVGKAQPAPGMTTTSDEVPEEVVEEATGEVKKRLVGEVNDDEKSFIVKKLNNAVRKRAPKAMLGGIIGIGGSMLMGGKLGLLGSMLLPGGPIGGAIAGMGIGLLSQNDTVKNIIFGKKGDDGKRTGGIISEKLRSGFKEKLPTLLKGAGAGIGVKMVTGLLKGATGGLIGGAGAMGVIPSMLLPGGLIGASLMGMAGSMVAKNENFQKILFGEKNEDGTRTGTVLSNMYNKLTGKIKDGSGGDKKKSILQKAKKIAKGMSLGALTAGALGHMGIIGASMSFGGPIGGAIMGTALTIASGSDKFNEYLYGKDMGEGKRDKSGLFSRIGTSIELNLIEPMRNLIDHESKMIANWLKKAIVGPLELIFRPVTNTFKAIGEDIKDFGKDTLKKLADKTGGILMKFFEPAFKLASGMLKKGVNAAGNVAKLGLGVAGNMIAAPLKGLTLLSGKRRAAERDVTDFMREGNDEEILENLYQAEFDKTGGPLTKMDRFRIATQYKMGKMKGVGKFFRNNDVYQGKGGVVSQVYDQYMNQMGGLSNNIGMITDKYGDNPEEAIANLRQIHAQQEEIAKINPNFMGEDEYTTVQKDVADYNENANKYRDLQQRAAGLHGLMTTGEGREGMKTAKKEYKNTKKVQKLRQKYAAQDSYNRDKVYDSDTIDARIERLQKEGFDIEGESDLKDFIYDFDGWKKKKEEAQKKAEEELDKTKGNETGEVSGNQSSIVSAANEAIQNNQVQQISLQQETVDRLNQIHDSLGVVAQGLQLQNGTMENVLDVEKAMLDVDTGDLIDTSDIASPTAEEVAETPGDTTTISDKIDDEISANVAEKQSNYQANAYYEALRRNDKEEEEQNRLENLRSNDTGKGNEEKEIDQIATIAESDEEPEKKKSLIENVMDSFGNGGGGILSMLAPAGIAAALAAALSNDKVRDAIGNLVGDAFGWNKDKEDEEGKEGEEGSEEGEGEEPKKKQSLFSKIVKGAGGIALGATKLAAGATVDAFGANGGVNDTRVLETDEEGNPTKVITNKDLGRHALQMAAHPMQALKAAGKVVSLPTKLVPKPIRNLVGGAASKVGGLVSKGFNAAADAGEVADLTSDAAGWFRIGQGADVVADVAADAAANVSKTSFIKQAGFAAKVAAKKGATKVAGKVVDAATAAAEGDKVFNKVIKFLIGAIEKASGVLGKVCKNIRGVLEKITSFLSTLQTKVAGKLFGKITEKLNAALAKCGLKEAANFTPLAVMNAVIAGASAIEGAWHPERLFNIDPKYVDGKMRVIGGFFEGLCGMSGVASLIAVVSDIIAEHTGFNLMQSIAQIIYNFIADDDDEAKLQKAIDELKVETENYNLANGTNISVEAYSDMKNKSIVGNVANKVMNFFGGGDKTDYSQYSVENFDRSKYENTRGSGFSGGGSIGGNRGDATGYGPGCSDCVGKDRFGKNVVYGSGATMMQNDPRWANMTIGTLPDGSPSTMELGGCGPSALAQAASDVGKTVSPVQVAKMAMNNGYISQGGANDDLFTSGAADIGLGSEKVNSSNQIKQALMQGDPIVMSGKDNTGQTPYTEMGHVVTLSGLDRAGNAVVEDPQRGKYAMPLQKLTSKMTNAWHVSGAAMNDIQGPKGATTAAGYGILDGAMGSLGDAFLNGLLSEWGLSDADLSGGTSDGGMTGGATGGSYSGGSGSGASSNNPTPTGANINMNGDYQKIDPTESAQHIWKYLQLTSGLTPIAASGVMGCWENESRNRADRMEGDYLGYASFDEALASNEALNSYTQTLFNIYDRDGIGVDKSAYYGTDGNLYPGIGLAQWTGPRAYNLFKYATDNGKDWRDLDTQLDFFNSELTSRGLVDYFNSAETPEQAAHMVLDKYEMYDGFGASSPSHLIPRQTKAGSIYATYKDMDLYERDPVTGNAINEDGTMNFVYGPGKRATGYGLIDRLIGGALGKLSGAFSSSGSDSSATTTTGGTTGGASSGGYSSGGSSGGTGAQVYTPEDYAATEVTDVGADNPFDTYNQSGGSTDGGAYVYDGPGLPGQISVVNTMGSLLKKVRYSLYGNQNPESGQSSCCSTVSWAYQKSLGLPWVGENTGHFRDSSAFQTVWLKDSPGKQLDTSILQPGDVVLTNWTHAPGVEHISHGEIYAGYGNDLSHGGPENGPKLVKINNGDPTYDRLASTVAVRRYTPFIEELDQMRQEESNDDVEEGAASKGLEDSGNSLVTTHATVKDDGATDPYGRPAVYGPGKKKCCGYGAGKRKPVGFSSLKGFDIFRKSPDQKPISSSSQSFSNFSDFEEPDDNFSISTTGQHESDPNLPTVGYGPISTGTDIKPVESRLDTIIKLLDKIAGKKIDIPSQTTPQTVNVNYGPADKNESKPSVVIAPQPNDVGKDDAINTYHRQMHRQIASTARFTQ